MTEFADMVERQRLLQKVEEWSKGIKYIHANNGVVETKFNNGDIEYKDTATGKITWQRQQATKDTLVDKFFRATTNLRR